MEHEIRESIRQYLWERFSALMNAREEIRPVAERLVGESPSPLSLYPRHLRADPNRIRQGEVRP